MRAIYKLLLLALLPAFLTPSGMSWVLCLHAPLGFERSNDACCDPQPVAHEMSCCEEHPAASERTTEVSGPCDCCHQFHTLDQPLVKVERLDAGCAWLLPAPQHEQLIRLMTSNRPAFPRAAMAHAPPLATRALPLRI